MHEWNRQSHVKWDCKYHIVFIPKYRQKVIYGKLRTRIGTILRELCHQKGVELLGERRMTGLHFCAKGYCVSTVGYDEAAIRQYIREQEERDSGQVSMDLD